MTALLRNIPLARPRPDPVRPRAACSLLVYVCNMQSLQEHNTVFSMQVRLMATCVGAVPLWQALPAGVLGDSRKQIPNTPARRPIIRLALVIVLGLVVALLTIDKFVTDAGLGSQKLIFSAPYTPHRHPFSLALYSGELTVRLRSKEEQISCPCMNHALPGAASPPGTLLCWQLLCHLRKHQALAQTSRSLRSTQHS